MTSHETYREQLLDLAYGELGKRETRALRAHLEECPDCRAELERLTATRSAMSALPSEPAPERGEAILLAAAREAARERNRPWLPSWVWGASVGVVGVAAVALVAVRLSGAVRPPSAQHEPDALVSRSAEAEEPRPSSPAVADSASSNAVADEPAQAAPPAAEAPAARFKTVPAPKGDVAKRKDGAAPARGEVAGRVRSPAPPAGGSDVVGSAADDATAAPPPRSAATTSAGPAAPAAAPPTAAPAAASPAPAPPAAEAQFAQPPPGKAPEPVVGARRAAKEQEAAPSRERDLSALEEKREAAPAMSGAGMKARVARSAPEDAVARYERLRAAGKLRASSRSFAGCPGESSRQVETDDQGRVAKVTRRGALEGTPYEVEQFYGEDGQLGAVRYHAGGATRELRPGASGADAAAGGVPATLLEPARAADAGLGAPPRCGE